MAERRATRVTFLITALGVGGAEAQLARLAGALRGRGWDARVLALREVEGVQGALRDAGVPTRALLAPGARLGPGTLAALSRALREERPDCLVTFLLQANVLGRLAGAWRGVPVVSSIRNARFGGDGRGGAWIGDALERLSAPLASSVVFNARSTAAQVVARGVVPQRTVRVVGNALPPAAAPISSEERARMRAELGLDAHAFAYLNTGRLQQQKNQLALLDAFARHRPAQPQARLLIAGAGPLEGALRERIAALSLGDAVTLLGLRRDLPTLLQAVDAFVLASRWEGLSNALMEALAAGLPSVATPVGGVDELIEDGVSGYLARSCEPDALLEALERLAASDAQRRAAIAATGRARVLARYGLEAVTDGWVAVIEEALASRRGRGRA